MGVIRCQACGKPNPDFLEKCQYCEARLKPVVGTSAEDTLIRPAIGTVRCQACGKPNPEEREFCQFCQARLKPLVANAPGTTPGATPTQPPAEDPLARLRSAQAFDTTPAEPTGGAAEAPADWMTRLRGVSAASPSEETIVPGSRIAGEPEPDWMFTEAAKAPDEGEPAWLRDEPPPPADAPRPADDDDLPDWLANLRSTASTPAAPAPVEPSAPAEEPTAEAPAGEDDELPEWLQTDEPEPAPRLGLSQRPRKKMTDWLNALPGEGTPGGPARAEPGQQAPVPPSAETPAPDEGGDEPAAPAGSEPAAVKPGDETLVPQPRSRRKKMTDWLAPAEGGLPPQVPTPKPVEPEADLPDWLKAMQPVEEVPDWLRDVASAPRVFNRPVVPTEPPAAETPVPPAPATADIGLPDWLRDVQPKAEAAAPEAALPAEPAVSAPVETTPPAIDDLPDWLQALRASPAAPPAELDSSTEAPPAVRRQQELPSWLKGVTGVLPPEPEAPAASAPEILADVPEVPEAVPESPAVVSEVPAAVPEVLDEAATPPWLAAASEAEPEPEVEAPAAQPGEYELPDWLRPSPEAMAAAEAELSAEPPVDTAAINAAELARAEEALPDWLRNLPAASAEAPAETVGEPLAERQPDPDIPAWLRPAGPPPSPPEPPEPTDTVIPAEVPDWLQTIQAQAASPTLPTADQASDLPPLDDETLAWLTAAASTTPELSAAAADTLSAAPAPDWLAEFKTVSEVVPAATDMDAVPDVDGEPVAEPTAVEDMPDWLRALRGMPTQEQQTAEAMPDWLRALRGIPPRSTTEITETPAAPETLAAPARKGAAAAGPVTAPAGEDESALPAWLAAMRPTDVEHPADAEVDAYEENVGVLAGMRGVLRAEPSVAQPHKSTTPAPQLMVAATHAKQAKLLAGLMAEEEVAPLQVRQPTRVAQSLERWIVFLVLALAILVPQFLLVDMFGLPTTMSVEAQRAFDAVDLAPVNQPALVAFDYEPAQQGELSPGAVAIITHLMSRGVPVVGVSTRQQGAAVAHEVLEQVAADLGARAQVSYTYGSQYLNLGYISGGPVGLLQFAAAPKSVFHADFTGAGPASALWTQPILRGVERLSDFGIVVLVTANPNDTRAWIEQTQAYAAGIPQLAVVSASAEPMVRPYIEGDTPQLEGLVAGLVGIAQYEQYAGLPGQASRHWSALGGGLWAAVLLIAGGNAVYATASVLRRRRR